MKLKQIAKKNLKLMGEEAVDIAIKLAIKPFVFGYTHASYMYFYVTNPHATEYSLHRFTERQVSDFNKAVNHTIEKVDAKLFGESNIRERNHWMTRANAVYDAMLEADHTIYGDWSRIRQVIENLERDCCDYPNRVQYKDRIAIRELEKKYLDGSEFEEV